MQVVQQCGDNELATVFVGRMDDGNLIEFVESVQPPTPREEKWVLIISTLKGCPVKCPICDAGGSYSGKLSKAELLAQIDYLIRTRFSDDAIAIPKLKIQFARMGDPMFNEHVLDVLDELPQRYQAPGLLPSISTIAPKGRDQLFTRLLHIKNRHYQDGRFQMQFSLHTTDEQARRQLVPVNTWSFDQMGQYGCEFVQAGDRKVALNFALVEGLPCDPHELLRWFPPQAFIIKLTPVNPTHASRRAGLRGLIDPAKPKQCAEMVQRFQQAGYETILSIGELAENQIGSNCGMYVSKATAS